MPGAAHGLVQGQGFRFNSKQVLPVPFRVVELAGVAKLVDKYVIDEFIRQFHQRDIQANCALTAATAPPAAGMAKA